MLYHVVRDGNRVSLVNVTYYVDRLSKTTATVNDILLNSGIYLVISPQIYLVRVKHTRLINIMVE